jgi:hypothetical protein
LKTDDNVNTIGTLAENTPDEKATESTPLEEATNAFAPDAGETNVTLSEEGKSNV